MTIKDNFSEAHLIFSQPVHFMIYQDETEKILLANFNIKMPTLQDLYFNENFSSFLSFAQKSVNTLKKEMQNVVEFNNHLELMTLLRINTWGNSLTNRIITGFSYICKDLIYDEDKQVFTIQGAILDDELFERIRQIILIASGINKLSSASSYMSPEQRAMEEKIQEIKSRGKKQNDKSSGMNIEKIYMVLTYEFGYSRDEILNMTMYIVKTILKYTSKSIRYKLTLAAKAYGNVKKVSFITDQGD